MNNKKTTTTNNPEDRTAKLTTEENDEIKKQCIFIGKRIRAFRQLNKISQKTLAQMCNYKHKSSIQNIENGRSDVSSYILKKIAQILKTTPSDLLDNTKPQLSQLNNFAPEDLQILTQIQQFEDKQAILTILQALSRTSPQNQKLAVRILDEISRQKGTRQRATLQIHNTIMKLNQDGKNIIFQHATKLSRRYRYHHNHPKYKNTTKIINKQENSGTRRLSA